MALEDYKELVMMTATVSSILQFMSGMLVVQKFMNKGSAENESGFPFVAGFLSCSLWLRYGYMIGDSATVLVNSVGSLLMLSYVIAYYLYTPRKKMVIRQLSFIVLIIMLAHAYSRYEEDSEVAVQRFGFFTCCMTLLFFAAPLANLIHVLRVKSADCLPFPIILMTLVVSAQWYIYGLIINNTFMQYPNMIGCILAAFQLTLFAIYPTR